MSRYHMGPTGHPLYFRWRSLLSLCRSADGSPRFSAGAMGLSPTAIHYTTFSGSRTAISHRQRHDNTPIYGSLRRDTSDGTGAGCSRSGCWRTDAAGSTGFVQPAGGDSPYDAWRSSTMPWLRIFRVRHDEWQC